ncbi:hypothetical protein ABGB07_36365 [Micromonosporaceae bacterium B7E4]
MSPTRRREAANCGTVLAAVAAGRSVDQLRDFLGGRMAQPELPATLLVLLDDVTTLPTLRVRYPIVPDPLPSSSSRGLPVGPG